MICFPSVWRWLKVWKNSSWVLSLPIINWISSINRTSMFLYLSRKFSMADSLPAVLPFLRASISSLVNVSLVTYNTFFFGFLSKMKCAMECIKWVFPSPTPPYKKRGLYTSPGDSATASEAAWAKLLFPPTTKVSKVYFGFSPAFSAKDFVFFFWPLSIDALWISFSLSSSSDTNCISYSLPVISAIHTMSGRRYFLSMYSTLESLFTRI